MEPGDDPASTGTGAPPEFNQGEISTALEVLERDAVAIADSYTSLFASLRLALSEVSSVSVDHMQCFGEAAGRLQESVLDASTKGNRYINSCLRAYLWILAYMLQDFSTEWYQPAIAMLNEEMKGVDTLATQLKLLRRYVDALDLAVNKLPRSP